MPPRSEIVENVGIHTGFYAYVQSPQNLPSRRITRGLRVLAVSEYANHHLHMALRLHVPSHDTKGHDGLAVLCCECGDDGVIGALATINTIRMTFFEDKSCASVLHADTGIGDDNAGTESPVVGLNE